MPTIRQLVQRYQPAWVFGLIIGFIIHIYFQTVVSPEGWITALLDFNNEYYGAFLIGGFIILAVYIQHRNKWY